MIALFYKTNVYSINLWTRKSYIFCWTSFDADNVTRMATDLEDTALLTKIDGGDLTALEAKYHLSCLTIHSGIGIVLSSDKVRASVMMEKRAELKQGLLLSLSLM